MTRTIAALRRTLTLGLLAASAAPIRAQSFNVDLVPSGTPTPTLPPRSYGGAAHQVGVWTSAHSVDPWTSGPLADLDGVTAGNVLVEFTGATHGEDTIDDPAWTGGDAELMEDGVSFF